MKTKVIAIAITIATLSAIGLNARVVLPPAYSNNMVLQQRTTFVLTAHAAPGSAVTVRAG